MRRADRIREAGVEEQGGGKLEVVVYDGPAKDRTRDDTRDSQEIGDGVDVLSERC